MKIITPTDFRAHQSKYLALAEKEAVYIARRNAPPVLLYVADEENEQLMRMAERVKGWLEQIKDIEAGKIVGKPAKDLLNEL